MSKVNTYNPKWYADSHRRLKLKVIAGYGGKCQCPGGCDCAVPEFLTIDHIKPTETIENKLDLIEFMVNSSDYVDNNENNSRILNILKDE